MSSRRINEAYAVVLVSVLAAALIIAGFYYIVSNLVTYQQTPPTTMVAKNWAGYAVASDLQNPTAVVIAVNGSWTVPSVVDIGVDAFSAVWVGVGGQYSKTLIQVGTEQDSVGGAASYYAWYEMLPDTSITIDSIQISPGDAMNASVSLIDQASNLWSISLVDVSSGQSFQQSFTYLSEQLSAEWIVERPDINGATSTLADFGAVTFTDCNANLNGNSGAITDFPNVGIIMSAQTSNNQVVQLADVSDISNQGTQFTVNYLG